MIKRVLSFTLVLFCAVLVLPFLQFGVTEQTQYIVLWLQLPLALTAVLVGASLSMSAASLQIYLHNPLADPSVIGIANGASLFAAALILFAPSVMLEYFHYWLPFACFFGAIVSTGLILRLAKLLSFSPMAVVLAGIGMTTLSGAIVAWLFLYADAQSVRNLTFWLMGSLHQADIWILLVAAPLMIFGLLGLLAQANDWNKWYLGEITAQSSGVDTQSLSFRTLLLVALCVGSAVSVAGNIAFIGLIVPHFVRLKWGYDNRIVLPVSGALGASLLLVVSLFNSLATATLLPVSLITASIGGPMLIWILLLKNRQPMVNKS